MKSRKRSIMTSTDRKAKKKRAKLSRADRIKILEYGLIALAVLLFLGASLYYGLRCIGETPEPDAEATASPVPTEDTSVRGMRVLNALEDAGISVETADGDYRLTLAGGVTVTMRMQSDDGGIRTLSFETLLCPDPKGDTATEQSLREENAQTEDALRTVFDAVMPVFGRGAAESETLVKQCRKVTESGEPYARRYGDYSVRIRSDADVLPQSVSVTFTRDR